MIREYVEEDAEAFFKLNSNPDVLRFVPDKPLLDRRTGPPGIGRSSYHRLPEARLWPWRLPPESTGEQIGFAGLKYLEELGEVDVAYRLLPSHWGMGFATEAALASVRFGFDNLRLKSAAGRIRRVRTIIGLVMPENIASARVLEKTGLRYADRAAFWGHQFSKYIIDA